MLNTKWSLKVWDVRMWTEFIWFRTGVIGRNLWTSNKGDIQVGNFRPAA